MMPSRTPLRGTGIREQTIDVTRHEPGVGDRPSRSVDLEMPCRSPLVSSEAGVTDAGDDGAATHDGPAGNPPLRDDLAHHFARAAPIPQFCTPREQRRDVVFLHESIAAHRVGAVQNEPANQIRAVELGHADR